MAGGGEQAAQRGRARRRRRGQREADKGREIACGMEISYPPQEIYPLVPPEEDDNALYRGARPGFGLDIEREL